MDTCVYCKVTNDAEGVFSSDGEFICGECVDEIMDFSEDEE